MPDAAESGAGLVDLDVVAEGAQPVELVDAGEAAADDEDVELLEECGVHGISFRKGYEGDGGVRSDSVVGGQSDSDSVTQDELLDLACRRPR